MFCSLGIPLRFLQSNGSNNILFIKGFLSTCGSRDVIEAKGLLDRFWGGSSVDLTIVIFIDSESLLLYQWCNSPGWSVISIGRWEKLLDLEVYIIIWSLKLCLCQELFVWHEARLVFKTNRRYFSEALIRVYYYYRPPWKLVNAACMFQWLGCLFIFRSSSFPDCPSWSSQLIIGFLPPPWLLMKARSFRISVWAIYLSWKSWQLSFFFNGTSLSLLDK